MTNAFFVSCTDHVEIFIKLCLKLFFNFNFTAKVCDLEEVSVDENKFRWEMNEDAMATDKLADGTRKFGVDAVKLENLFRQKLQS